MILITLVVLMTSSAQGAASYSISFIKPIEAKSPSIYGFNGTIKNLTQPEQIPQLVTVQPISNTQFDIVYIPPAGVVINLDNLLQISCSFSYIIFDELN